MDYHGHWTISLFLVNLTILFGLKADGSRITVESSVQGLHTKTGLIPGVWHQGCHSVHTVNAFSYKAVRLKYRLTFSLAKAVVMFIDQTLYDDAFLKKYLLVQHRIMFP